MGGKHKESRREERPTKSQTLTQRRGRGREEDTQE